MINLSQAKTYDLHELPVGNGFQGKPFGAAAQSGAWHDLAGDSQFAVANHLQVKRATQHLLEQLFSHVSGLSQLETDSMLGEDTDLMQRRAATKQVSFALSMVAQSMYLTTICTSTGGGGGGGGGGKGGGGVLPCTLCQARILSSCRGMQP